VRVNRTFLCAFSILCATHHAEAQSADDEEEAAPDGDDEPAKPAEPATEGDGEGKEEPLPEKATVTVGGIVEAPELDAPLAGAVVTVVGTKNTAITDDEGRYTLEIAPGTVRIRVDFVGFKSEEKPLNIEKGDKVEIGFQLVTATLNETIVVVGSRTPRTNVDSPVPVDVVTSEEIARSGRTETGRVLHALAASYISAPQTIADGSDHVDPASLRGLGPDQVLILVNGKRRHRSALMHVNGTFGRGTVGTDLNAIAVGSIKRIEILRDGAASQYGSDAIAGVINIVTKDVTDLLDVTTETGITAKRDGAQLKASANYGFKLGENGGFLNLTGEFLEKQATSRGGTYTGTIFNPDKAIDDQIIADEGISRDDFGMKIGEAASTSGIAAFNMELPLSDVAKFYSFGDVGHRRGSAAGFRRFPKEVEKNVPDFYPRGFLPLIQPTIDDASIAIGIRRKGDWNVNTSLLHGRNSFTFNVEDSVNASLGTASPLTFDAGTLSFDQTVADVDLLHKIDQEELHAVNVVLGSELRIERYRIEAGDVASYFDGPEQYDDGGGVLQDKVPGAQVFPGFQPSNEVDRRRDSIGLYAGLESELTKKIALDIGGRFENYSDFGRSIIGKIAGRAKLGGPLAVRGGFSTGFRAPSLQQLWFSNVSTQFVTNPMTNMLEATQVITPNNASPITREAFNIPSLREERSLNASGGITLKSGGNFSLTADGYYIRLKDRIVLTSLFPDSNPIVAGILAPFGVDQAQFFANAVNTRTTGLDIVADYSTEAGSGTLALTGSINFTSTKVTDINIPGSLLNKFGGDRPTVEGYWFSRLARNRIEDSVPHQKGTVAVRYTIAGLTALARANYYGSVEYKPDNPDNDETFGAKVLFDLDFGYQFNKNVLVTIGADNVFDTKPDEQTKAANISFGRFIYSRNVTQFGQNGGFYYAKLELTFF
jgi:iron complex outermembrane receptor protein